MFGNPSGDFRAESGERTKGREGPTIANPAPKPFKGLKKSLLMNLGREKARRMPGNGGNTSPKLLGADLVLVFSDSREGTGEKNLPVTCG